MAAEKLVSFDAENHSLHLKGGEDRWVTLRSYTAREISYQPGDLPRKTKTGWENKMLCIVRVTPDRLESEDKDALLVCKREDAQDVREVVYRLKKGNKRNYL